MAPSWLAKIAKPDVLEESSTFTRRIQHADTQARWKAVGWPAVITASTFRLAKFGGLSSAEVTSDTVTTPGRSGTMRPGAMQLVSMR